MSDPLQPLLERIQTEGLAKAQQQAQSLLQTARAEAEKIREEAQRDADALRQKAALDAAASVERGRKTLELAARDLLLSVRSATIRYFENLLAQQVGKALAPEELKDLIRTAVQAWLSSHHSAKDLELLVPPDIQETLKNSILQDFQQQAGGNGLLIHADPTLTKGFKVVRRTEHVELDFTPQAIAEALSRLLRPHLADIVRTAAETAPQKSPPPTAS